MRIRTLPRSRMCLTIAAAMALLLFAPATPAQEVVAESPKLTGAITEASTARTIWLGAIEVYLRDVYVPEEKAAEALQFMRSLATRRRVACILSGERAGRVDGPLVGRCVISDPADGKTIDLSERLIGLGYGRPCQAPQPAPMIWPPVYRCE